MANIASPIESTLTRQRVMATREAEAQRLRVQWAIADEYARRTTDGEDNA
jgi:hypothetical protein